MKITGSRLFFGFLIVLLAAWSFSFWRNDEGVTPLMLAARNGDTATLKARIAAHDPLDARSRYGWTALMFAAWQGHQDELVLLLDAGANPDLVSGVVESKIETTAGMLPTTALRVSLEYGKRDIASLLIDRGAKVDAWAVALAGGCGDTDLLEKLDRQGVDWSRPCGSAFHPTALLTAAESGNEEAIRWLLGRGVDVNAVASNQTALTAAIAGDYPDAVRFLLENGANPNVIVDGETALWRAVNHLRSYDNSLKIVGLLLAHGADRHFQWRFSRETPAENVRRGLTEVRAMSFENQVETPAQSAARKARLCEFYEKLIEILEEGNAAISK